MSNDDILPVEVAEAYHYHGPYRPQFHYTPIQGHIGDPTGLIHYKGEYHLFYMYDPWSMGRREHKNWGHAVSSDCIHWQELPPILDTLIDHKPGSGCGIVDWNNSSGLRRTTEKTLIVYYTDYERGTCITYSNDKSRTWLRHQLNPILEGTKDIRDPYVFWYAPTDSWRMVRYELSGFAFYSSENLTDWTPLSRLEGFYECPDICRLPVDGDSDNMKWVLIDGDGSYYIGEFDGTRFLPETEKLQTSYGRRQESKTGLYATQTWKHTFEGGGPVIQVGFVGYITQPRQIWNGQLSFPCELTLRSCTEGLRQFRYPIDGIRNIYVEQRSLSDFTVSNEATDLLDGMAGDAFDIQVEIELTGANSFAFDVRGERILYDVGERTLSWNDTAPLDPVDGHIRLRLLVDRSSIEVFGNDGIVSITSLVFPDESKRDITLFAAGGPIRIVSMLANRLESIWQEKELGLGYGSARLEE